MPERLYYKAEITKNNKTETYQWGGFTSKEVNSKVKEEYKNGADAVCLELITLEEFTKDMPKTYLTE